VRRLSPAVRKLTLTVHVAAGVGWLGVHAVLILLAATGLTTGDETLLDAVYVTAGEVVWLVFPFAVISLVSGVVLSVGTPWGLFRHLWVTAKLAINVAMLAVSGALLSRFVEEAADRARDGVGVGVGDLGPRILVGSTAGFVLLVVATALSVYRPRGRRWTRGTRPSDARPDAGRTGAR
jgi:hypothetical protein